MNDSKRKENRYAEIVSAIFHKKYKKGTNRLPFGREEFSQVASEKGIVLPKNIGDAIYSFKYRTALPARYPTRRRRGTSGSLRAPVSPSTNSDWSNP